MPYRFKAIGHYIPMRRAANAFTAVDIAFPIDKGLTGLRGEQSTTELTHIVGLLADEIPVDAAGHVRVLLDGLTDESIRCMSGTA